MTHSIEVSYRPPALPRPKRALAKIDTGDGVESFYPDAGRDSNRPPGEKGLRRSQPSLFVRCNTTVAPTERRTPSSPRRIGLFSDVASSHITGERNGGFDPRRYEVHPIADPVAKSYVERHHYSRSYVAASRRYGMFLRTPDGLDLVGVAVFAVPAQARVLTNVFPDLAPYTQSLELGRFVLEGQPQHPNPATAVAGRAPSNSETWFLRQCFRHLAADGIAGVVSFADPVPRVVAGRLLFAGHVGTIYQAKGAVLTGRSASRQVTVLPDVILSPQSARGCDLRKDVEDTVVDAVVVYAPGAMPAGRIVTNPQSRWLPDLLHIGRVLPRSSPRPWC